MGKLAQPPHVHLTTADLRRRSQLRAKRRELATRIQHVDAALAKLTPPSRSARPPTPEQLDQLFDQISQGLPDLSPLPANFSRADLYEDHD
jgi:hypothetical protein